MVVRRRFRNAAVAVAGAITLLLGTFALPDIPPAVPPPSCTSVEVAKLLERVIRSTTVGTSLKSIFGLRELSYDRDANVRQGECVAHIDTGDIQVKFVVEWQDHNKGLFQVRIPQADLPSCTGPEVARLLEQMIRSSPVGNTLKSIDSHRELSYDRDANVRHGECVAHTDAGDIQVKFVVEWQDRDKDLFQVRIPPADLPSCTSVEVAKLLDQVIRSTTDGITLKSIDGHRELSYDRDANVRHGECVAHTDAGDIQVKFVVEWQDRDKDLFQVRIIGEQE